MSCDVAKVGAGADIVKVGGDAAEGAVHGVPFDRGGGPATERLVAIEIGNTVVLNVPQ